MAMRFRRGSDLWRHGGCLLLGVCLCLFSPYATCGGSVASEGGYDAALAAHQANEPWVVAQFERDRMRFSNDDQFLIRRGLLASRCDQTVQIYADSAGLSSGEPIEYYLVGENSSHIYEALAVAFASPGDVREGLAFIGMEPGRSIDHERIMLWPKGERVFITVECVGTNNTAFGSKPLAHLLWKSREGQPPAQSGFVFTGSRYITNPTNDNEQSIAADAQDPHSILPTYSEPDSVLDVPYRIAKGGAYGEYEVNSEYRFAVGSRLRITMRPEHTNGVVRVLDLALHVRPRANGATTLSDLCFDLVDVGRSVTNQCGDITALLAAIVEHVETGRDPFATLHFDRQMTLGQCHQLSLVLAGIETENGIRIEPPPDGDLYYRAFIPEERLRDREDRHLQPLELHLNSLDAAFDATIFRTEEEWGEQSSPTLKTQAFHVDSRERLVDTIQELGVDLPILLVYAVPGLRLGDLLDVIEPVRVSHRFIHIFLNESDAESGG